MPPSPPLLPRTVYLGAFAHFQRHVRTKLDIIPNGAIGISPTGTIEFIDRTPPPDIPSLLSKHNIPSSSSSDDVVISRIPENHFIFPGFIDTHIHAPQYPNAGIFGKSTLLDWLETYTFPMEASMTDLNKARRVYTRVVQRTLSHGTTCAAYYATRDVDATNLLADICLRKGQRALVGRVCMDNPEINPEFYNDRSVDESVDCAKRCIEYVKTIDPRGDVVRPIVTPRFAPSCSGEALSRLSTLAKEEDVFMQTHVSENENECALVNRQFPEAGSYVGVYKQAGLLGPKTILAHGIHFSEEEKDMVKDSKSSISHCPVSNSSLASGMCRVRWLLDEGIKVGLGTDVSGGYSPSVLESVRQAVLVSRFVGMKEGGDANLSVEEALYLATRGGAEVVGLEDKVGGFDVGMEFDAMLVGMTDVPVEVDDEEETGGLEGTAGPVDVFGWEDWDDRVHKWVYNGDDRNTLKVWVKGRLVHERK